MRHKFLNSLLVGLLILQCFATLAADEEREKMLKAAYLINILSFITWTDSSDKIVLCIHQHSPILPLIISQEGRIVGKQKSLHIVKYLEAKELCNALYWDADIEDLPNDNKVASMPSSLLTISDKKGALDDGFAIQFYTRNLKLRFAINDDLIKAADYRVSSKLMRLASQVD